MSSNSERRARQLRNGREMRKERRMFLANLKAIRDEMDRPLFGFLSGPFPRANALVTDERTEK